MLKFVDEISLLGRNKKELEIALKEINQTLAENED